MIASAIRRLRPHALALASYAVLAALFVAPVLGDPVRRALGHPGNDVWNHVWGYAWVADALLRGELPVRTGLLGWPSGGSLWFIDTFGAVLTLPVQLVAGPVAAYDSAIGLDFFGCGAGAYLLALKATDDRLAAWFAGLCFCTTPQLLGQAYNGISETLAAGWLPLTLAFVLDQRRDPTVRRGAIVGALWAVTTVANWYYGLFVGFFALGLVRPARRQLLPTVTTLGTFAALAGPPFVLFSRSMTAADALVTRDPTFVWRTLILHNMTDAVALVHPGRFYSPDLKAQFGEDLLVVVYLGAFLLVPALAGLAARPRGAAAGWLGAAVGFTLVALGPYLYVGGDYVQVHSGWVPLPFLVFFQLFPAFSRISHAYRFVIGASLALSVAAAWGVRAMRQRGWDLAVALPILVVGRVVETCFASPAVFPLPVATVAVPAALAHLDGGAVLDLPVGVPVLARSAYLAEQLVHHQPVPYGLNDPTPPLLFYNHYTQYLLQLERSGVAELPDTLPALDLEVGRAALVGAGLRWIVVHQGAYPADQLPKVLRFLDLSATRVEDDGDVRVYRLDRAW